MVFLARLGFNAGGDIDSPGMQKMDRVLHVAGMEPAGNDELADAVNDAGPGLHALPIKGVAGAAGPGCGGGIEQHAGDDAGAKTVGFEEEVAVMGDVNLVYALAFVRLVGLNDANRNGVPSDGFVVGLSKICAGQERNTVGRLIPLERALKSETENCLSSLPCNCTAVRPTVLAMP